MKKRKKGGGWRIALIAVLVLAGIGSVGEQEGSEKEASPIISEQLASEKGSREEGNASLDERDEGEIDAADESLPAEQPDDDAPNSNADTSWEEPATPSMNDTEIGEDSIFSVHFIDVGQADAALVLCDGHSMLIDGGNSEDSNLIYAYLKREEISYLDYIVATHGHEDHVGGLAGALNYADVGTAYCSVSNYDSEAFEDFSRYLDKRGKRISVPSVGERFTLGSAAVEIVGVASGASDANNTSIILRITYGETAFLFTGDAEREAEQAALNSGLAIESTVLKVGHHGSEDSTTYPFLRAAHPKYAVISVGKENSYGHPTEDVLSRLRDADVQVFRTDLQGDIICTSDGTDVTFSVERNPDADTLAEQKPQAPAVTTQPEKPAEPEREDAQPSGVDYVLNLNTKKFHYPSCRSVKQMKESNKSFYTGAREEVVSRGYSPCGNCHP